MSKLPSDLSTVTTVAVDLAKHVIQVHGCDAAIPGTQYYNYGIKVTVHSINPPPTQQLPQTPPGDHREQHVYRGWTSALLTAIILPVMRSSELLNLFGRHK